MGPPEGSVSSMKPSKASWATGERNLSWCICHMEKHVFKCHG